MKFFLILMEKETQSCSHNLRQPYLIRYFPHFTFLQYFIIFKMCLNRWENKKSCMITFLLSIFQIFNVAHRGLHIVPGFVVEREQGGVIIRAVSQGPVRSAFSKGTRFAIRRQPIHLFFFIQEREFHFYFNCTAETQPNQKMCQNAWLNKCIWCRIIVWRFKMKMISGDIDANDHQWTIFIIP